MKATHLILSFIAAATAWAGFVNPLVVYVKVDNNLVPLYEQYATDGYSDFRLLSYGNSSVDPAQFVLEGNHAFTDGKGGPGYISFVIGLVALQYDSLPGILELNNETHSILGSFQSCEIFDPPVRVITYGDTSITTENCFDTELYILPYDKTIRIPEESLFMLQEDDEELFILPLMSMAMDSTSVAAPSSSITSTSESSVSLLDSGVHALFETEESTSESSASNIPSALTSSPAMMASSGISESTTPEILKSSVPTMIESSQSLVSTSSDIRGSSVLTRSDIDGSSVSMMASASSSSGISYASRLSTLSSVVPGESSINKASKLNPTTLTRETTSTATICTECKADSHITVWNTYTDYTTYCSEETTVKFTVCEEVCFPSTVTVTSATTLTITGVCIIPETVATGDSVPEGSAETAEVGNKDSPKGTFKSPTNPKNPVETAHVGEAASNAIDTSIASNPKSGSASGEEIINPPKPESDEVDEKTVQTVTSTVVAPSVSSLVNGAAKDTIGACVLVLAALLL